MEAGLLTVSMFLSCMQLLMAVTFRWRTSFLFSLIFGIPAMIVMIFSMVRASAATCPTDNDEDASTTTVSLITAADSESDKNCDSHSLMLLPGLSLENLLLFLLCTPCQVR